MLSVRGSCEKDLSEAGFGWAGLESGETTLLEGGYTERKERLVPNIIRELQETYMELWENTRTHDERCPSVCYLSTILSKFWKSIWKINWLIGSDLRCEDSLN